MQKIWKDYGAITIGTILIGLATKNIFDPASMVTGGVSGIAIIGKELWNLPLWVTNTVLNIPLFLAGFKIMGWKFIKRTLYATVLLSVAFYILPEGMYIEDDLLLSALFGGIITGRRLHYRGNRYAGRSDPGKIPPLFRCADHAGIRRAGSSSRCNRIWDPRCPLCTDRYFLYGKSCRWSY